MKHTFLFVFLLCLLLTSCKKGTDTPMPQPPLPASFSLSAIKVNNTNSGFVYANLNLTPSTQLSFSAPLNEQSVKTAISLQTSAGTAITYTTSFQQGDSTIIVQPSSPLQPLTEYIISVSATLQSKDSGHLQSAITISLATSIDSTDKFPRIPDDSLLTIVQKQTFKYFWDFGH